MRISEHSNVMFVVWNIMEQLISFATAIGTIKLLFIHKLKKTRIENEVNARSNFRPN